MSTRRKIFRASKQKKKRVYFHTFFPTAVENADYPTNGPKFRLFDFAEQCKLQRFVGGLTPASPSRYP